MQPQEVSQVFNFENYPGPVPGVEDREETIKIIKKKRSPASPKAGETSVLPGYPRGCGE